MKDHHNVRKLPPWSPMFNPIKEVFSNWKFEIKRILAEADVRNELMNLGDNRQVTMIQWRKKHFEKRRHVCFGSDNSCEMFAILQSLIIVSIQSNVYLNVYLLNSSFHLIG